ncbi:MAG: hypothetical protein M3Z08_15615 [Chloroflexota bacterium]|nr:hypothetical protein [Chloroflexota bacterium]
MTLMLALATAFTLFSLVFSSSEAQRIHDVSTYQAGADFSGMLPQPATVVVTCALALLLLIRVVLRPSISQMLRLNED